MARKCPNCGKELVQNPNNPEYLLCEKCNKNYKKDKSSKKTKSKKKKGGKIFIIVFLVVLLLAAASVSIFFFIKYKDGQKEITLTIPAEFIDEQTQERMKEQEKEFGYKLKLNDDGSATCTMTKSQHKKMMAEMADSIKESMDEMIGSESCPNFTKIEANDNFTEFTITTKSTQLDMVESFSTMAFYIYGGLYNAFSGEEADNISVTFVNANSGQVIETTNSSDMAQSNESQENLNQQSETVYTFGQPWVVDGKWSLTINSITATDQRNEYAEKNPAQVLIIDYSYENIGEPDGIFFDLSYGQIVDSTGLMGYSYPGDIVNYPQTAPVGATCNAQACIAVDNVSTEIKITISQYDSTFAECSATFSLPIS